MGLCLIAATGWSGWFWGILQVALGIGFVIFVHELGHFAVAKWCGVQCDKFFVGFDIGGYKLSRKWGETEYGIGILPLGGYVKMMGQDDNPAHFEEQLAESQKLTGSPDAKEIIGPKGERLFVNRRSYMAKSVPQRMAIISAGVIMNIIFAAVLAFFAYGFGVPEITCSISGTAPGSAAWEAGLRTGDRILKLGEIENPTYEDLQSSALLGDLEQGLPCVIRRAETNQVETLQLIPKMVGKFARLGVAPPISLRLSQDIAVAPGTAADQAKPAFEPGDEIAAINDNPVKGYHDLVAHLSKYNGQELIYTVRRGGKSPQDQPFAQREGGELVNIVVPASPLKGIGVVPTLGPIVGVQHNSPAEQAGVKTGERILAINGTPLGAKEDGAIGWDPLTLEAILQTLAQKGEEITITLVTDAATTREVTLRPRVVTWFEGTETRTEPIALSSLGVACEIEPTVAAIAPDSPAAKEDIKPGDKIVSARFKYTNPKSEDAKKAKGEGFDEPYVLKLGSVSWPALMSTLQAFDLRDGPELEIQVSRDSKNHQVSLPVYARTDAFSPKRGTSMEYQREMRYGKTIREQASLALTATKRALLSVYTFLGKIGEGQVPLKALGGPVTIAKEAYGRSSEGLGKLLMFLTMLSANLAVINFLPIPMLDGGHMAFLSYEALRGKPAGEKFVMALHTLGFVFLISLMAFVFGLDFGWIPRNF